MLATLLFHRMKLKNKLNVFIFTFLSINAWACEVCGNYIGLTPYQNKNSVSIFHRYRVFNGYRYYQNNSQFFPKNAYRTMHGGNSPDSLQPIVNSYSSKDFESFKVFELRLKFFIAKRIEVNGIIPLNNNKSYSNGQLQKESGLGDVSLNAGYHLIIPNEERILKQKLVIGSGLKIPTGECNALDIRNNRMALEMQCGTGSVDGFAYLNYFLIYKNLGFNLNSNIKINGTNKYREKISNSSSGLVSVFYKFRVKQFVIYPALQANYEYTKGIMFSKTLDDASGVSCLLGGPGLDLYYRSFSFSASWHFTLAEKIAKEELRSTGRITVGLNYMFGGKNK